MSPPVREAVEASDGGWGWLVLAGGFVVYFINDGMENCFGLVAAEIIRKLEVNRQSIGWIVSLKTACMCFVCPFAAALCRKLDIRAVGSIAGFLSFVGFFFASFASKYWHLVVTIGLLTGPGVGTCFFITIITVCLYFNKLRATATGIALCGSGLGGLTLSLLVSYLLYLYGWQGSLLLMSGLYLNTIACCLLFRPLEPTKEQQQEEVLEGAKQPFPPGRQMSSESLVNGDPDVPCPVLPLSRESLTLSHNKVTNGMTGRTAGQARWQLCTTAWFGDFLVQPILWPTQQLCHETTSNNEAAADSADPVVSANTPRYLWLRWWCYNPRLLAFHASRGLLAAAVPAVYVYSADRGLRMGLTDAQAAGLMSIISACSMFGRFGFGCLGDSGLLPPMVLYGLALVSSGCLMAASLTARGFAVLAGFMGPACCFMGGSISLTTLVTVHLDGTHRLFFVFARQSVFQGIGVLIGTPLAGAIFDKTDSYSATFAMISAFLIASGLLVLAIHCSTKRSFTR